MAKNLFSEEDIRRIEEHGLSVKEVERQIDLFQGGMSYAELVAPCTADKGVLVLDGAERERLADLGCKTVSSGDVIKFVPASGAATRMFRSFLALYNSDSPINRETAGLSENSKRKEFSDLLTFMENIERFALYEDLAAAMARDGLELKRVVSMGSYRPVLKYLLTGAGLGYGALPKGMIKFHRYIRASGKARCYTALEEHLAETVEYLTAADRCCKVHFTAPEAHLKSISEHLENACGLLHEKSGVTIDVTLSTQARSSDTIAVDLDKRPFRDKENRLLFRPGGHGSLLENLNSLGADMVFIKNVDNISTKPFRDRVAADIHALVGLLAETRSRVAGYLNALETELGNRRLADEILAFVSDFLNITPPPQIKSWDVEKTRTYLLSVLNRPIRVCGVVKNAGEPGGGPFLVKDREGGVSPQIVEAVQVDPNNEEQRRVWQSATHFNPVIIVCHLRTASGKRFDLREFVDRQAYIITEKSFQGRPLLALEHPGLWNGSMAFWNTLFVELPSEAFNPVKTVLDLLRDGHLQVMEGQP